MNEKYNALFTPFKIGNVEIKNRIVQCSMGGTSLFGCLEAYCSASGITRTARELLELNDEPSTLREIDNLTAKDVQEAAFAGDKIANQVYAFTGRILGEALAGFIAFSAPEAIILFGGVAKARRLLYEPAIKAMNEAVCPM